VTKAFLRKEFLARRLALTAKEAEQENNLVSEKAIQLLTEIPFQVIHIFLPQRNRPEVDTWKILSRLQSIFPEKTVAVPYVIPSTKLMQHHVFSEETILIDNKWNIPEPDPLTTPQLLVEKIDVIILPLLAFDRRGYRVGYGGGFYDRFLSECKSEALKIGLSFFDPVEQIEDVNEYDVAMDYCVTPAKVWRW